MFKVVVWDYTGESETCAKGHLRDDVEIIHTLRPDDPDQAVAKGAAIGISF